MKRLHFERLVERALEAIPDSIKPYIENVDVVVEESPSNNQLVGSGISDPRVLLGLYEGVPLTDRGDYYGSLPDKITIFQSSIESFCSTDEEVWKEVCDTVIHEIAHHFGIDDASLHDIGR